MFRTSAVLSVLLFAAASGWAQTQAKKPTIKREPAPVTNAIDGHEMFNAYCAACHGRDGRGDGPAAAALKEHPTDLTLLAKNHGGTFSMKEFQDKVAGEGMTPAHGSSDMPVWGPIFKNLPGNETLRVYNLKQYVDTLQVK